MSEAAKILNMRTALYRHYDESGNLLYVGVSLSPITRTAQHSCSAPWFNSISRIDIEWHENRKDALIAERSAILSENPSCNIALVGVDIIDKSAPIAARFLTEYMSSNGISAAHLASQVGVTRQYIWALAKGTSLPRVDVAIRIEDATNGAVPVRSWVE